MCDCLASCSCTYYISFVRSDEEIMYTLEIRLYALRILLEIGTTPPTNSTQLCSTHPRTKQPLTGCVRTNGRTSSRRTTHLKEREIFGVGSVALPPTNQPTTSTTEKEKVLVCKFPLEPPIGDIDERTSVHGPSVWNIISSHRLGQEISVFYDVRSFVVTRR